MNGVVQWAAECGRIASDIGLPWFHPRRAGDLDVGTPTPVGVLPLWSFRDTSVGLRMLPGVHWTTWPAVLLRGTDCWTLASDGTTLVPQLLVRSLLRAGEGDALEREWSRVEDDLLALHAQLGGDRAAMTPIATVLGSPDPPSVSTMRTSAGDGAQLVGSLFRAIDPSPAAGRYADWLDAVSTSRTPVPAAAETYGPWSRRVVCWSEVLDLAGEELGRFASPARHAIIEAEAGVDTGVPLRVSWGADIGRGSAAAVLLEAAMRIRQEPDVEDPVIRALALAMDTEGPEYRGLAHAEAVVVLKDRGEPVRAWGALQSAAWWSSRSLGVVPPFAERGGLLLAEENGWTDIAAVLELRGSGS